MALTVFKSSAGSGKTFTLVKEYIKLLILKPQDYKHILAITFTNKATEEMKSRILQGLKSLSLSENTPIQKALLDDLGDQYDAKKVAIRAKESYEAIIHDYSRFEVSTIDSFFSKVLKSFAKELDLPLTYEVEMNTELALSETIENLFRELEDHKEIRHWLNSYVKDRLENDKGWNIDKQIQKLGKNLFNESFQEGFKGKNASLKELSELIKDLKKEVRIFENRAKAIGVKAFDILSSNGLTLSDFNYGKGGALSAFYALEKGDYDIELRKRFIACLEGGANWGAKKSEQFDLAEQVGRDELHLLGQEALSFISEHRADYLTQKVILKNIYAYGLLEALNQKLKEYRDEHNVMLISDTNHILREIIQEGDAPFIFEKIGSYFKHIMIDEFQDTSNYQWMNIKPLVINALSEGNEVLIVGDVKQSIYRFRGGNMRLLLHQIKKDLGAFYDSKETDKHLTINYRSAKDIVEFNNDLFSRLPSAFKSNESLKEANLLETAFESHSQKVVNTDGGFVSFKFFEEDWKEQAITHLLESVFSNTEKGYQYADMLVLVNRNGEIPEVANAFLNHKIPFINGESLRLEHSDIVQFLLELLRYLSTGKDDVLTLNLKTLYSRAKGHEDTSLFEFQGRKEVDILSIGFPKEFFDRQSSLKQLSVFELISELLIIFDFSKEADVYLQQLLDLVLEQSQKGVHSIATFLEWWEKKGVNQMVATSEQTNAIRILSIHKSKGLEAPIVFIPFTNWDLLPSATNHQFWTENIPLENDVLKFIPLDYSKNQLEKSHFKNHYYQESQDSALDILNKTYVAFTRPREKLYLSAPKEKPSTRKIHQLIEPLLNEIGMASSEEGFGVHYSKGVDHEPLSKTVEKDETQKVKVYPDSSYLEQLTIRNDSERFFMLQDTDQARNISLGNQVHDVLSDVKFEEDLDLVLKQRLQSGLMSNAMIDQVKEKIENLFNDALIKSWFSNVYEVFNERSLWYEGKELKPDRLMFKGEKAIVIDYKKEVQSESHMLQVKRYMTAVHSMGYQNVEGFLVYVESGEVKEVPF